MIRPRCVRCKDCCRQSCTAELLWCVMKFQAAQNPERHARCRSFVCTFQVHGTRLAQSVHGMDLFNAVKWSSNTSITMLGPRSAWVVHATMDTTNSAAASACITRASDGLPLQNDSLSCTSEAKHSAHSPNVPGQQLPRQHLPKSHKLSKSLTKTNNPYFCQGLVASEFFLGGPPFGPTYSPNANSHTSSERSVRSSWSPHRGF